MEFMMKNRGIEDIRSLTNGPGRLTKALKITQKLNTTYVTNPNNKLIICKGKEKNFKICSSHRIGVTRDLRRKLRFFVKGNKFVSR
ncbi:MAG: DNA-3-methyladenine glycosylase [Candidatus Aenigmarchaeota archaeon]|nr:DNA-3-methyladenine glycosylase [Candidatus Aenigmarchaeota archaeon]